MEVKFNKEEFLNIIQAYYRIIENKNVTVKFLEFKEDIRAGILKSIEGIDSSVKPSNAPLLEISETIEVVGIKKVGSEKKRDFTNMIKHAFIESGYEALNIKYDYDPNESYISNDTFRGIIVEYEHKKLNETKAKIKEKIPYPGLK